MSRPISLGYLTPPEEAFSPSSWVVTPMGAPPLLDPSLVESWQYDTDLSVEKTIRVDLPQLRTSTHLTSADELRGVLIAKSTRTGLQHSSEVKVIRDGENTLSLHLRGAECGGALRLRVCVTSGSINSSSRLAPSRAGSLLWSQEHRVFLEGDQSRFPTEVVSFATHPTAPIGAAWSLEVDAGDLAAPAIGCVRLILNSDHAAYGRLASEPGSPQAERTKEFMRFDVARQLVVAALTNDEFGPYEYEEGTLGWVLRGRLMNYFGEEGFDVDPLRARWRASPWEIDAQLQASFEL